MNILAVEPLGERGHVNSNAFFLRVLAKLGDVTLATFASYHSHFAGLRQIEIPDKLNGGRSALGRKVRQLRSLRFVQRVSRVERFDIVFFLCFDEISFAVAWRPTCPTFLFEHNNLDGLRMSRVKEHFYRRLPNDVYHLAYMPYIGAHISNTYQRRAFAISHPYYRTDVGRSGDAKEFLALPRENERTVLFSPSGGTTPKMLQQLKSWVSRNREYFLVAKATTVCRSDDYRCETFFECYERELCSCDYVLFTGEYDYRVSGVVFEALSYGKPVIALDCRFARELQRLYPHMVFVVQNIKEIVAVCPDFSGISQEHERFLREHSCVNIRKELANVFSRSAGFACEEGSEAAHVTMEVAK